MVNRNILLKAIPFALSTAFLFFAAETRADEVVGIVTSVSGRWHTNGVPLTQGQKLDGGAVIRAKEPNIKYARVVILLLDYTEVSRICDRKGLCGEPLSLPAAVNPQARRRPAGPPGFWQRFVGALALSRRRRTRATLARGGEGFIGAVVKLEDGRIALSPGLSDTVRRFTLVEIERADVNADASPAKAYEPVRLKPPARGRVRLIAPGITPGLYKITFKADGAGDIPPLPLEVLALVAGPQQYRRAAREFSAARELSKGWGDRRGSGADEFLMTFLQALAGEKTR